MIDRFVAMFCLLVASFWMGMEVDAATKQEKRELRRATERQYQQCTNACYQRCS